MWKILNSKY